MYKLLVVLLVFLIVFKPQDLPRLIKFVTQIISYFNKFKQNINDFWDNNIQKEIKLEENIKKAQEVDEIYAKDKHFEQLDK